MILKRIYTEGNGLKRIVFIKNTKGVKMKKLFLKISGIFKGTRVFIQYQFLSGGGGF